jgi:hypothetical protein
MIIETSQVRHAVKEPKGSSIICLCVCVTVLALSAVGYRLAGDIDARHAGWSVGVTSLSPNN